MAMSEFGKAFASARKAGDKTFMFKGKKYTTETKEEKDARMAKAAPKAAPEKEMPEAKSSGRGMMAGRRAEDKPRVAAAQPERKPIRMEGLERATKGFSGIMADRRRRIDMEEADRMSRGDKYGMGMKKGGKVKKSRDGMASKGKTKGRMC